MIDMLMEAEDEDGKKLEDEDIVDVLLLSLSVGSDSSAITTLWAIVHLTEHPKVLQKAKVGVQSI
jgi:ent-kaurenoic acid hydroxylase